MSNRVQAMRAAMEAINNRHHLAHLFNLAVAGKGQARSDMLGGLLNITAACIDGLQRHNVMLTSDNKRANEILGYLPEARAMHLSCLCTEIDQETVEVLTAITKAVYEVRDFLSFPVTDLGDTAAEKSDGQPVTLVQIVGMPERVTDTQVDRGRDGDIVRTSQYERDAKP